jgi:anti-sigma B factor antagonist
MEVKTKTVDQILVVEVSGEIDGKTAPQLQAEVLPKLQPDSKVLVDMSQVNFMSSAGLRMMVAVYRQASSSKMRLVLAGVSQDIQDTMSATGFLHYFTICETVDTGLEALR